MSEEFDLIAELRDDVGKGASRRLRHAGKVPAILYGGGRPPRNLAFDHNKVLRQLENESFYSSILNIKVGDKSQAAVLRDLQRHPAKRQILHMDLMRIVEGEKLRMTIPIHFVGEDKSPGVRQEGGTAMHQITDVEVYCLPKDLPEYLEVDVSGLHLNEMLHLSDLELPPGVEIPELAHGDEDADQVIVSIQIPKMAPIEEPEEEEDLEAEAAEEGAEEGEEADDEDGGDDADADKD